MTKRFLVAGFAVLMAAGCSGSDERQAEQQIQQGAEQVTATAGQMAQGGTQQVSQSPPQGLQQKTTQGQTNVVDYEVLKGVLPSVNGWTQSSIRGEQTSMPLKVSRAEARYSRGNSNVELEITDTARNQLLLGPVSIFVSSGYSERSDDGFVRSTTFGSQPGFEDWNSRSRRGEVTAIVNNRFIVKATGQDVDDLAAVRQIVDAVDFSTFERLK